MDDEREVEAALRSVLVRAGLLVGPSGYLIGLVYYFGFERTRRLYFSLGVDSSQLKFGLTDYALRSADALVPLAPHVIGALLGVAVLHAGVTSLVGSLDGGGTRRATLAAIALGAGAALACAPYLWSVGVAREPSSSGWVVLGLLAGTVLANGVRRARPVRSSRARGSGFDRWLLTGLVAGAFLLALAAGSFRWTQHRAHLAGRSAALAMDANPQQFPCASLVLTADTAMAAGPGRWNADAHTLDGLRLILVAGGRLFLFDATARPSAGTVAIEESTVEALRTHRDRDGSGTCG